MRLPFSESQRTENTTRAYRLIPGNTVTVRADAKVLAALDATIREAIHTIPKPGVEVGGFLIGELAPWIQINGFEMLEIEHLFDRSVQLSPRGLLRFRRVLADRQKQVIGLFRSHTRGEPGIVEADNVIAKLFADLLDIPDPVLLLLPASPAGLEEARLYRRVDSQWAPALRFPLILQAPTPQPPTPQTATPQAATPQAATPQTPTPQAATPHAAEPSPPPTLPSKPDRVQLAPEPVAGSPPPHRRLEKKVLWALAGGVAAAVALGYFGFSRPSKVTYAPAGLGLQVQQLESGLQVRWNQQSPDIQRAVAGILKIQDGDRQLTFPMARELLRSGSAFYLTKNAKVDVRLEVFQDDHHFRSEVATTADTRSPAPESPAPLGRPDLPQPDLSRAAPPEAVGLQPPPDGHQPKSAPPEAVALRPPPDVRQPKSAPLIAALPQPFAPPPRMDPPRQPVEAPVMVAVAPPKPFLEVPSPALGATGSADRTDAALPIAPQFSQPQPSGGPDVAALRGLLSPPAILSSTPQISYAAATPIRKVRPAIPANLRSSIQSTVLVEVKVVIDSAGKVVSVTPVQAATTAQRLLAPQAAQAALLWQFQPARRNGVPVYSETVLTFEFERPPR